MTVRDDPGDIRRAPIHIQLLETARQLCNEKDWTFRLRDVVGALPHLNAKSVYADASRCCVNAPRHHAKQWEYFRRARNGVYEILPRFRRQASEDAPYHEEHARRPVGNATEASPPDRSAGQSAIHVVISESEGWFVAECLEIAVVTQGRSLDATMANLRSALELHLDDEELARTGLSPSPRLAVSFETPAFAS